MQRTEIKGKTMKLTELKIAAANSWAKISADNPLVCSVKLSSDKAIVETALSDDDTRQVLRLVQRLVADAAARNVAAFVDEVTAIEASGDHARLETDGDEVAA